MGIVFDGKGFAKKIEEELVKSGKLKGKKLLIVSNDPENPYVRLKRESGERCGVNVVMLNSFQHRSILNPSFAKGYGRARRYSSFDPDGSQARMG